MSVVNALLFTAILDVVLYTVRLLNFRTDYAERILRAPSGGHPQKHAGASLDTLFV
jgi:hypothetical protein